MMGTGQAPARQHRGQVGRHTVGRRQRGQPQPVQHRGGKIQQADRLASAHSRRHARTPGQPGHMQQFLKQAVAVADAPDGTRVVVPAARPSHMVQEFLAVIGEHRLQRGIRQAPPFELGGEGADGPIHLVDGRIVDGSFEGQRRRELSGKGLGGRAHGRRRFFPPAGQAAQQGRRGRGPTGHRRRQERLEMLRLRRGGFVGIVQQDEAEKWALAVAADPVLGHAHHLTGLVVQITVMPETLGQAEGEELVGVEGRGAVTLGLQVAGEGGLALVKALRRLGVHVADPAGQVGPVQSRHVAGQRPGKGGQGPGRAGAHIGEDGAPAAESVEVGGSGLSVSPRAQVIGPQGVHADQDQIGRPSAPGVDPGRPRRSQQVVAEPAEAGLAVAADDQGGEGIVGHHWAFGGFAGQISGHRLIRSLPLFP